MTLNDFEVQLYDLTRALLLNNVLRRDSAALCVAVQVVRSGLDSLDWEERFLYLGRVVPLLRDIDEGKRWVRLYRTQDRLS